MKNNEVDSKGTPTASLGHTRGDSDTDSKLPRSPGKIALKDAYDRLMGATNLHDQKKAEKDLIDALFLIKADRPFPWSVHYNRCD